MELQLPKTNIRGAFHQFAVTVVTYYVEKTTMT